ncbi:MAG: hypothetical protein HY042_04880 [Spirochaetia bacterium]|nr:hypothetical protein [Spirochaetia bacterium]
MKFVVSMVLSLAVYLAAGPVYAQCVKELRPNQATSLAGDWAFMPGTIPQAGNPDFDDAGWRRIPVPGKWSSHELTKKLAGDAWYRCKITLEGSDAPENQALFLGRLYVADEVFFNGTLVGRTGSFSPPASDFEKMRLYSLPGRLWKEGENVIAVHLRGVSGDSGFYDEPKIGKEDKLASELIVRDIPAIICSFVYLLVAAFFGIFVVFFWHDKQNLFFALFSAALGLYHLIRTGMRYSLFDSFETSFQAELILLIALPPLFLNFLAHLINVKKELPSRVVEISAAVLLIVTLFVRHPVGWVWIIRANLLVVAAAVVIVYLIIRRNYEEHKDRLRYILYGFVVLLPAILNDAVVTLFNLSSPRVLVFAFLVFLLFVSLELADSILALYRNMTEQEQELRQLEKRKTSSIFNIASEFNTIFAGIRDGLDALSQNGKKGKANGTKKQTRGDSPQALISSAVTNLQNLLNDSSFLALLESGEYTVRRVRFSLRKLSQEVISRALLATQESSRRITPDLPEEDVEVTADPDLISAALYHLVENALLYSKGKIEVTAEKTGGALKFVVRDEGPGLSPDQQSLIFQRFVRAVDDSSEIAGSGLGLALVDLIARRLDGSIKLESGAGFFSNFTLTIPLAEVAA